MRHKLPALLAALIFQLSAHAADLRLQVLDTSGAAVPAAVVTLSCQDRPAARISLRTTSDGIAESACGQPAEVRVVAPGFEPVSRNIRSAESGTVVLRLVPALVHTTIDVVVRDAADAPITGSALEIDRSGARTVFDAVEKLVPAAFITRRGVMGYGIATNGTGSVSIRGIGEQPNTGVLVVIDGRPDFQGLMGHPLPDFYSLSDAESVSVTQGPASVLYGSNAMAGAIEIKPTRPEPGIHTRLRSSLGSYLTGQHQLAHGGRSARAFYNLTAGVSHTGGDRPSSAFRSQDVSTALGREFSRAWRASLQGRYGFFHVEDPGPVQAPLNNAYARVGRGGFSLNLDDAYDRTTGYIRLYGGYGRHFITDGFRSVDQVNGGRLQQTIAVAPGLLVDVGGDVNRYGGRARNVLTPLDYGRHELTDGGAFSRAQWTATGKLKLTGGFRYHQHSLYGGIAVPELGGSFQLTDRYSLAASVARGFRNPTIRELYLFPAPNPALRPESMWNYQATFQARPSANLQAWSTVYYASLSEQIVTTGRFPSLRLLNAGASLNRGLDANMKWRLTRRLKLTSGYAYLRSTNLAPLVPRQKLTCALEWQAGWAFIDLGATKVGRRFADAGHTAELGPYSVASLRLSLPVRPRYAVFVFLDNLLNRRYQVLPGYPMPGTNATAGFTLSF